MWRGGGLEEEAGRATDNGTGAKGCTAHDAADDDDDDGRALLIVAVGQELHKS